MSISKRLRYEILRRDNHTCRYCGAKAPDVTLTVDHVTPTVLGGTDAPANLVAACVDCNSGKSSSSPGDPLVEDVAQDAVRWSRARELILREMADEGQRRNHYIEMFIDFWTKWAPSFARLPENWESSIIRFHEADLPLDQLLEAAGIAMDAKHVAQSQRFVYMCGICWKKLDLINAATMELVRSEAAEDD